MEEEISRFFTMIGHPLRRKIIQYLGEHGQGGFLDLKTYLNVSTGTLYYQIDFLADLLEQDEAKKYLLNEKGRFAYKLLSESYEKLASSHLVKRNPTITGYVTLWLIGWNLISRLYATPMFATVIAVLILLYGALVTYLSGLYPVVFIYLDQLSLQPIYIPILFISGYLLVNGLTNIVSYIAYRAIGDVKQLFLGSAVSFAPALILPTIYVVAKSLQTPLANLQAQILMLIGVGYSLCFLTSAISLSKGLTAEKAALSASIILYVSLGLAFILTTF